jgi:uncharacterized protein (DUF1697 family)
MQHVALLYTVVITPTRRVKSAELLTAAMQAGLRDARTVLSTGNLAFRSDAEEPAIAAALEQALLTIYAKPIAAFVRSAPAWRALVAANPFPAETALDASRVAVRVMRDHPDAKAITRIAGTVGPGERFAATDRALWLAAPTQLSSTALLRAVGAPRAGAGTLRSASALAKITQALDGGVTE